MRAGRGRRRLRAWASLCSPRTCLTVGGEPWSRPWAGEQNEVSSEVLPATAESLVESGEPSFVFPAGGVRMEGPPAGRVGPALVPRRWDGGGGADAPLDLAQPPRCLGRAACLLRGSQAFRRGAHPVRGAGRRRGGSRDAPEASLPRTEVVPVLQCAFAGKDFGPTQDRPRTSAPTL